MEFYNEVKNKLKIDLNEYITINEDLVKMLSLKTNYYLFGKLLDLIIDDYTDHKILYSDSQFINKNYIYSFNESFYNFLNENNIKNANGYHIPYNIAKILIKFITKKISIVI